MNAHSTLPSQISLKQAFRTLVFVAIYIAGFGTVAVVFGRLLDVTTATLIAGILGGLTAAIMLAIYVHLIRRNRLSFSDLGFRTPSLRMLHLSWQIPLAIVSALSAGGITMTLFGDLDSTAAGSTNQLPGLASAPLILVIFMALLLVVVTPLWEEVLFRGAFFSGFSRRLPPFWAIVLSAAFFASLHVIPLAMPYLFVLGVSLAWLYKFHQNLWAPILLHAANNALAMTALLAVS